MFYLTIHSTCFIYNYMAWRNFYLTTLNIYLRLNGMKKLLFNTQHILFMIIWHEEFVYLTTINMF